jgi:hypothetical protein
MKLFDRTKSLKQLESVTWPTSDLQSHVVKQSLKLREVPLSKLGVEDLRLLIAQSIGLRFLVPIAIEKLNANPLVEGAYYPGDLLDSLANLPDSFWSEHPDLNNLFVEIAASVYQLHDRLGSEIIPLLNRFQYKTYTN